VLTTHFYAVQVVNILERDYPAALGPRTPPPSVFPPQINDWLPANLAILKRTQNAVTFTYPLDEAWMLRMPLGRPHVFFALDMPAQAREVRVWGPGLEAAQVFLTSIDPRYHCDLGLPAALPRKKGRDLVWPLDPAGLGKDLNTVRLVASFAGADRTAILEVEQ
jgi:hypothetical protein